MEALDERPRARVGVGIDLLLWMAVAREESGQPQHVGISGMPDEFDLPIYDGDLDANAGLPPGGLELKRRLDGADGVLIQCMLGRGR